LIVAVNGQPMHSQIKFHEITEKSAGNPIEIEYERNGERHTVSVKPTYAKPDGPTARWMIGVVPQPRLHLITTRLSLPDAFRESIAQNSKGAMLIVEFLKGVVQRRMSPKTITGPIGIAQLSGQAAREGPSAFFMLMAMVSLNLAIVNLLPIPIM